MANVPRGAPKGKKSFEVFEDVTIDDLTVSTGLTMGTTDALTVDTIAAIAGKELVITGSTTLDVEVKLGDAAGVTDFHVADSAGVELFKIPSTGIMTLEGGATIDNSTSATNLAITETNIGLNGITTQTGAFNVVGATGITGATTITGATKVVGAAKQVGEWTTRNAADDSMYHSIAASSGHERGMKVAYDIVSNDGGYFDALYANVRSGGITGGELRGIEAKASIAHDMSNGAIATGVYAKVAVADAAQVDTAIGLDVLLEESGTGAITSGIGVRVQGGDGAIDYALDSSGDYRKAAIKMPELAGAAITAATIAGAGAPAESAAAGDTGFVGLYKDSADSNAISAVFKYAGLYYHVKLTDTADS